MKKTNQSKIRQIIFPLLLVLSLVSTIFAPSERVCADELSPKVAVVTCLQILDHENHTFSFMYASAKSEEPTSPKTEPIMPETGETQNILYLMLGWLSVAAVSFLSWFKLGKIMLKDDEQS
ncbi:MAG: hypothetical protein ACTID1_06550 [Pseudolactococcus laudensis]|uniref:hypothetical protein n=1 Tax=Pseudolactococcus laudensis TaxID=1494461 RepID=UPI00058DFC7A|nr:hypothetical protein [Lactococcus sp.]